jgi:tetratricopeptide (TPR) repeat protein
VLGCVSYHAGDIETALVHFMAAEAALPCRPDVDIAVYENLALSFRERGDWTLAAEYFTRAAHRAAFRTLLWTRAAHARLQSGETDTAADLWEHARRLDTNVPPFHALVSAIEANKRTTHAPQP